MDIDTSKWRGYYVWTPPPVHSSVAEISYPDADNTPYGWSSVLLKPDARMHYIAEGWETPKEARAALRDLFYPEDVVVTADELRALISMELAKQALDG